VKGALRKYMESQGKVTADDRWGNMNCPQSVLPKEVAPDSEI
jgi:hypothetical protein